MLFFIIWWIISSMINKNNSVYTQHWFRWISPVVLAALSIHPSFWICLVLYVVLKKWGQCQQSRGSATSFMSFLVFNQNCGSCIVLKSVSGGVFTFLQIVVLWINYLFVYTFVAETVALRWIVGVSPIRSEIFISCVWILCV